MIVELPVYQKGDHTYCQECKPSGSSRKSTLVTSGSDVCCSGCGESFRKLADDCQIAYDDLRGSSDEEEQA